MCVEGFTYILFAVYHMQYASHLYLFWFTELFDILYNIGCSASLRFVTLQHFFNVMFFYIHTFFSSDCAFSLYICFTWCECFSFVNNTSQYLMFMFSLLKSLSFFSFLSHLFIFGFVIGIYIIFIISLYFVLFCFVFYMLYFVMQSMCAIQYIPFVCFQLHWLWHTISSIEERVENWYFGNDKEFAYLV